MFSDKRITEKKVATLKSIKSLKSLTFNPDPQVFVFGQK